MLTRRRFLRRSMEAGLVVTAPAYLSGPMAGCARALSAPGTSGDPLVNHVGFAPSAAKFCMLAGASAVTFSIVDRGSSKTVRQGTLSPRQGDLGSYLLTD